MNRAITISNFGYDDIETVKKQIERFESFQVIVTDIDSPDEKEEHVGLMFHSTKGIDNEMIFASLPPDAAIILCKSILEKVEEINARR